MAQVLGRVTVKFNGEILLTEKGAKLNLGGVKRDPVTGDVVHGFVESVEPPGIDVNISVTKDTDLDKIKNVTNATVTFEADTGQVWVLKEAWSSVPLEITGGDSGKVPVKFHGMRCDKL